MIRNLIFFSIAVMEWWWGLGYHTMFFLAGLAAIPKDLFDAARTMAPANGACSGDHVFAFVPIILVLMVVRFGSAMAVVDEYIIAGGMDRSRRPIPGPSICTTPHSEGQQFRGYAAAIGWLGAILMMLFVVCGMFWLFRRGTRERSMSTLRALVFLTRHRFCPEYFESAYRAPKEVLPRDKLPDGTLS